jgi:hypothetical protein
MAVDAVGRRSAAGLLGRGRVAIGVFAGFADALAVLFIGFAGESRGDLKSVEVDTLMAADDAAGGECAENLIDGDLNSGMSSTDGRKIGSAVVVVMLA